MRARSEAIASMLGQQALWEVVRNVQGLGDHIRAGLQGRGSLPARLPAVLTDTAVRVLETCCAARVFAGLYPPAGWPGFGPGPGRPPGPGMFMPGFGGLDS